MHASWKRLTTLAATGMMLGAFAAVAGCSAVVDENAPRPEPRPRICPAIHAPVCAVRDRQFQVFPNACAAEAAGWRPLAAPDCSALTRPQVTPLPRPST